MTRKVKKKELKMYKRLLTAYLTHHWEKGHTPSLRQAITSLGLKNKPLLIITLRQLRSALLLDGSYDLHGIYRLYPFKKYLRLASEVGLPIPYEFIQ